MSDFHGGFQLEKITTSVMQGAEPLYQRTVYLGVRILRNHISFCVHGYPGTACQAIATRLAPSGTAQARRPFPNCFSVP